MSNFIDLTGKKYNLLTVIEKAEKTPQGKTNWMCRCECGNIVKVNGSNLRSGSVKSCGCLRHRTVDSTRKRHYKLYLVWSGMKDRCRNKNCRAYVNYGGRGIQVCDEWSNFDNFVEWALANGYKEGLTIERVDVNGNYDPHNCIWITKGEQSDNRRSCRYYTYKGKTQNLRHWCDEYNVEYQLVHNRVFKLGWDFEKALLTPVNVNKRNELAKRRNKWQNTHLPSLNL